MSDPGGQRAGLVAIAQTYIGTPYLLGARVKGAGVDCATYIGCVLIEAGLATEEEIYGGLEVYHHDWHLHTADERYMLRLLRHSQKAMEGVACKSSRIEPGNLLLCRTMGTRKYSHGGIVVKWPMILHAIAPAVRWADAVRDPMWAHREIAVFDPFRGAGQVEE